MPTTGFRLPQVEIEVWRQNVAELVWVREPEQENSKAQADVRRPGAGERGDQGPDRTKAVGPLRRREVAVALVVEHRLSVRRACRVARLPKRS